MRIHLFLIQHTQRTMHRTTTHNGANKYKMVCCVFIGLSVCEKNHMRDWLWGSLWVVVKEKVAIGGFNEMYSLDFMTDK